MTKKISFLLLPFYPTFHSNFPLFYFIPVPDVLIIESSDTEASVKDQETAALPKTVPATDSEETPDTALVAVDESLNPTSALLAPAPGTTSLNRDPDMLISGDTGKTTSVTAPEVCHAETGSSSMPPPTAPGPTDIVCNPPPVLPNEPASDPPPAAGHTAPGLAKDSNSPDEEDYLVDRLTLADSLESLNFEESPGEGIFELIHRIQKLPLSHKGRKLLFSAVINADLIRDFLRDVNFESVCESVERKISAIDRDRDRINDEMDTLEETIGERLKQLKHMLEEFPYATPPVLPSFTTKYSGLINRIWGEVRGDLTVDITFASEDEIAAEEPEKKRKDGRNHASDGKS